MRTIWKYECEFTEAFHLMLPIGAIPIFFGEQDGKPFLWCEIPDDSAKVEWRFFGIFGTGNPLQVPMGKRSVEKHIGSFINSYFVWHLYELAND